MRRWVVWPLALLAINGFAVSTGCSDAAERDESPIENSDTTASSSSTIAGDTLVDGTEPSASMPRSAFTGMGETFDGELPPEFPSGVPILQDWTVRRGGRNVSDSFIWYAVAFSARGPAEAELGRLEDRLQRDGWEVQTGELGEQDVTLSFRKDGVQGSAGCTTTDAGADCEYVVRYG